MPDPTALRMAEHTQRNTPPYMPVTSYAIQRFSYAETYATERTAPSLNRPWTASDESRMPRHTRRNVSPRGSDRLLPLWAVPRETCSLHDAPGTAAGAGRRCPSLCDNRLTQQPVRLSKRLEQASPTASMRKSAHTTAVQARTISRPSLHGARWREHRLTRYAFRWQEPAVSTSLTPAA